MIRGLTKNAGLKLLALLLAFGLWVLVAGEQESVRVFNVPLDLQLAPEKVLSGQKPAPVQVRVRGSESVLRALPAEDLSIPVDLTGCEPMRRTTIELAPGSVRGIPAGAAVDTILPDRLVLAVEELVTREVPVTPGLVGSPAEGWHLVDFVVDPPHVTIEGPRSEVDRVPAVRTDPILLQGRREGFTVLSGLAVAGPRTRVADARPVRVTLRIERDTRSR